MLFRSLLVIVNFTNEKLMFQKIDQKCELCNYHETELREYDSYRAKLKKMLSSDEKITPKKWTAEKTKLEERLQESNPDYARVVTELASTEVIEHNHKMLAMTREAEQNQRSQIHSRKKNEQSL